MDSCTIIKCPICGKPYKVYAFSADNQSACPTCKNEAEKGEKEQQKREAEEIWGIG